MAGSFSSIRSPKKRQTEMCLQILEVSAKAVSWREPQKDQQGQKPMFGGRGVAGKTNRFQTPHRKVLLPFGNAVFLAGPGLFQSRQVLDLHAVLTRCASKERQSPAISLVEVRKGDVQ